MYFKNDVNDQDDGDEIVWEVLVKPILVATFFADMFFVSRSLLEGSLLLLHQILLQTHVRASRSSPFFHAMISACYLSGEKEPAVASEARELDAPAPRAEHKKRAAVIDCSREGGDGKPILQFLRSQGITDDETVCLLQESPDGEAPTRQEVIKAFELLVRGAEEDKSLFLYLRGSCESEGEEGDARKRGVRMRDGSLLTCEDILRHLLAPLPPHAQLTALLDCCDLGLQLKYSWDEGGWQETGREAEKEEVKAEVYALSLQSDKEVRLIGDYPCSCSNWMAESCWEAKSVEDIVRNMNASSSPRLTQTIQVSSSSSRSLLDLSPRKSSRAGSGALLLVTCSLLVLVVGLLLLSSRPALLHPTMRQQLMSWSDEVGRRSRRLVADVMLRIAQMTSASSSSLSSLSSLFSLPSLSSSLPFSPSLLNSLASSIHNVSNDLCSSSSSLARQLVSLLDLEAAEEMKSKMNLKLNMSEMLAMMHVRAFVNPQPLNQSANSTCPASNLQVLKQSDFK
eukprot:402096-Hanusia_phi.AAC.1